MSQIIGGVEFDLGDGWLYAQEAVGQTLVPGVFSEVSEFLLDKNGNDFQTETEYRLFARHPDLYPEPQLFRFTLDASGVPILIDPVDTTPGNGQGGPSTDVLDIVSGRSDFPAPVIDSDYLSTYQPHPVNAGKVLIRPIAWSPIWNKLISLLTGQVRVSFLAALGLRLRDLTEWITDQNISIDGPTGNLNIFTNGTGTRGLTVLKNEAVNFFAGQYADNSVGISDGIGQRIGMNPVGTFILTEYIQAGSADTLLRTLAFTRLRAASLPPTGVFVPETAADGITHVVSASPTQVASMVQPYIDIVDIANRVRPLLTGETIPGDARAVLAILCRPTPVPPVTYFSTAITPTMIGVQQSHNLQVPKEGMIRRLYNINGDPETEMKLTLTGNQYWQVDYPEGVTEGYEGGAVEFVKLTN